jgi:hypothetical protein
MNPVSQATDSETIRRTAEEILRRPEYQSEPTPESGVTILEIMLRLLDWIISPFRWLFGALEGLPDILRWTIVLGLALLLVLLILHLGVTLFGAIRGNRTKGETLSLESKRVQDPAKLEQQSLEAANRQDYIGAVRLLFLACLLRLEAIEKRAMRAGMTNRELLRRHQKSRAFEAIKLFVETIESKWYGQGTCELSDYEACRAAHARIVREGTEVAHADRA